MVVGYNEGHFLDECLSSISFCDEIVYTDLGSTDNSVEVAEKYTTRIFHREKVPSCEFIQAEMVNILKNDWVIFIDPDERVDLKLQEYIRQHFHTYELDSNLGAVNVPWIFYFKNKRLNGTIWGGINEKTLLVNRKRFQFLPVVHYGRKLMDGFTAVNVPSSSEYYLHHYWMNSYKVFIAKHKRYLVNEGKDHFKMGYRFSLKKMIATPFREFNISFFEKQGFKDGFIGFKLSVFWAWYRTIIARDIWKLGREKVKANI